MMELSIQWALFIIQFVFRRATGFERHYYNKREIRIDTIDGAAQIEYQWFTKALHLSLYVIVNSLGVPEESSMTLSVLPKIREDGFPEKSPFHLTICNGAFIGKDALRIHKLLCKLGAN